MREIIIDESSFSTPDAVHAYIASELGFPAYYGANLDALSDCLGDVDEPCAVSVYLDDAPVLDEEMAAFFARFVRTLLRAARDSDRIDVLVHATSLRPLARLAACPGLVDLLDGDAFVTQGIVACLTSSEE